MYLSPSISVLLVALTASTIAQTITESPSTTATETAAYDYCTSTTTVSGPVFTPDDDDVIPPIPCENGIYSTQEGFCCMGSNSTCDDGKCQCIGTDKWWQLPLDDCVKNNPQWSGCPGNMQKGLCCAGPGIGLRAADKSPTCLDGSSVFTVRTANGTTSTSTFPGASTSLPVTTTTTTSLSTTSSPAGAARTGAPGEVLLAAMAMIGAGGLAAAL